MKVALLFAGISYGYKSDRDFRHCYPNINSTLIEPFKKEHEVFTYLATYQHEFEQQMVEMFQPVKHSMLPWQGGSQLGTRLHSLLMVDREDIDFFVMSRFDVHYNMSLENFNLDYNKFNIVSREGNGHWERQQFVGDTFFAWPKSMHSKVVEGFHILGRGDRNHQHNTYSVIAPLVGYDNIHFMSEEHQLSGHLLTSICTQDYVSRLRNTIPINKEILSRFS